MSFRTSPHLRPAKQAEAAKAARRLCGEPRPRMRLPALEGDAVQRRREPI